MTDNVQKIKIIKGFMIALPLFALFLFRTNTVVEIFNQQVTGSDMTDLNVVKKLFQWHDSAYTSTQVKHFVGYFMAAGCLLLGIGELILRERFLNIIRFTGMALVLGTYASFSSMDVHSFGFSGFWIPSLFLLIYGWIAYNTQSTEHVVPGDKQVAAVLWLLAIFALIFMPFVGAKEASRVFNLYHNHSGSDAQMAHYTYLISLIMMLSCFITLTASKTPLRKWMINGTFLLAILCHITVFCQHTDYLHLIAWGFYASFILIVIAFVWTKGICEERKGESTLYEKLNRKVNDALQKEETEESNQ